jgi:coenzyme F420-0:L-glutamate ligase/coenzyme F420-1:gamma-L-glutamate ligase
MPILINRSNLEAIGRIMTSRRSIRRYRQENVPHKLIDELLACAVDAPSAHNRQPWRFVVLDQADQKIALARTMGERLRSDRLSDGDPPDVVEKDVTRSFERISSAPVVILVAATTTDMHSYPDSRRQQAEYLMAVQSTAMAVQNLLLAAHVAELGACWMCAPLFCPDTVRNALGLQADWQPQAIITLGFPASDGKPYSRQLLTKVVRYAVRS